MSERSTEKETLSINFAGTMRTNNECLVSGFIDDMKELLEEWQKIVQVTSLTISVHDNRKFELVEEKEDTQ
jgi:hypothetical protein